MSIIQNTPTFQGSTSNPSTDDSILICVQGRGRDSYTPTTKNTYNLTQSTEKGDEKKKCGRVISTRVLTRRAAGPGKHRVCVVEREEFVCAWE